MQLYSELLAFLETHGRPLAEFGCAEFGLSFEDAHSFVDLLYAKSVSLLGIEIWRNSGSSYTLNGLEVWYPVHDNAQTRYQDALQYLASIEAGPSDVFAIQFS